MSVEPAERSHAFGETYRCHTRAAPSWAGVFVPCLSFGAASGARPDQRYHEIVAVHRQRVRRVGLNGGDAAG